MSHPVVARLRDPDPAVRREACREAARDPSAVLLVPALAEALADRDPRVCLAASESLAMLAPQHPDAEAALAGALHSDDDRARFGAAHGRARLGPPEPALLPALVGAFADPEPGIRWAAARIFVELGRFHGEAVPVAIGLARTDPNPEIRRMAVFCLAKLAPGEAAATLQDAMQDPSAAVRQAAVLGLESPDQKTNASRE